MKFGSIPNKKWLNLGASAGLAMSSYLAYRTGPWAWFHMLGGLPIAYLFLMFTNPKEQGEKGSHLVAALPSCAIMWPIILLAMLAGRPWKDPKWINRDRNDPQDVSDKGAI